MDALWQYLELGWCLSGIFETRMRLQSVHLPYTHLHEANHADFKAWLNHLPRPKSTSPDE